MRETHDAESCAKEKRRIWARKGGKRLRWLPQEIQKRQKSEVGKTGELSRTKLEEKRGRGERGGRRVMADVTSVRSESLFGRLATIIGLYSTPSPQVAFSKNSRVCASPIQHDYSFIHSQYNVA